MMLWEKIQKIAGSIFLILIALSVMFVTLDILSRKFLSNRSPVEKSYSVTAARHPQPYTMFGGRKHARNLERLMIPGSLNRLGHKGKIPEIPKAGDEYRIIMVGGSAVLIGQPSLPELLEMTFKDNGYPDVKVYNFGVISSVSGQEVARIVFEISNYSPDLIVMYNGANDIMSPLSGDPRPGYPYNFIVYENNPLLDKDIDSYPLFALMAYGSNILRAWFPTYFIKKFVSLDEVRKEVRWKSAEWEEEVALAYVNNVIKAWKISKAFDSDFIAFFQPTLYYKDRLDPKEDKLLDTEKREYGLRIREKIRKHIGGLLQSPDNFFYDLSDIYDDDQNLVFFDEMHSVQSSKPVVARALYERISSRFLEPNRN